VFLLALAIIDDLGAIIIIALFYTANLSGAALTAAAVAIAILAGLRFAGVQRLAPFVLVGIALWLAVLKSGVHATLAGVMLAFALPGRDASGRDIADGVAHGLEPWVRYAILPVFAFANAGVALGGAGLSLLVAPIPLAIILGLVIGKPLGILAATLLAVRLGLAELPKGLSTQHILAAGAIAGIGFTMSLFIGMLAFPSADAALPLRVGVLAGSIVSAVVGLLILRRASAQTA
jgi:NhaA family Na+:H+ antiporter